MGCVHCSNFQQRELKLQVSAEPHSEQVKVTCLQDFRPPEGANRELQLQYVVEVKVFPAEHV